MEKNSTYDQLRSAQIDPSHDVLGREIRTLDPLFNPGTIAVIGASDTPQSVGRALLKTVINHPFGATVFPVNLRRPSVHGVKAYARVGDVPEAVDLAIVATPPHTVPGVIRECVDEGVPVGMIMTSGFRALGEEGLALQREILEEAARGPMRLLGPDCMGIIRPPTGMNLSYAGKMPHRGKVGLISQSGALCQSILDWSLHKNIGFSAFIAIGNMIDVGWGDLIDYLGRDPHTTSIVIYMESINDARSFVSAAREVALSKPIIVIKAGRTEAAARAAASHTGALIGRDDVFDAAFDRCGILRVDSVEDLFSMVGALAQQPTPRGPRLAILTNAGGAGVIATDALAAAGGRLAPLSGPTLARLEDRLPDYWSRSNPVDIQGDAGPDRYAQAFDILVEDDDVDGVLVVLSPQPRTDPTITAERLSRHAEAVGKPVLASWMGGDDVVGGAAILRHAGIPTFEHPDVAARMYAYMWRFAQNLKALYETPSLVVGPGEQPPDHRRAGRVLERARDEGRTILNECEALRLLQLYHIPTVRTEVAYTEEEALQKAQEIGYPVALKVCSNVVLHKVEIGGVLLNLHGKDEVGEGFRLIRRRAEACCGPEAFLGVIVQKMHPGAGHEIFMGSMVDEQFGPVIVFGTGGSMVEVYRDRAFGLPPLNTTLARRMIEQTLICRALRGMRGRAPCDLDVIARLLVRFSLLVAEHRHIKEFDVNPLVVTADSVMALDARALLFPSDHDAERLPGLAVAPYPEQYVQPWTLPDGSEAVIRPIRPEDEPLLARMHESVSEESVYFRYFHPISYQQRVEHWRLSRFCFIDYDREMALVVETRDRDGGERSLIAAGRLQRFPGSRDAEFSVLVRDDYQRRGVGTEILRRLIDIGRDSGLRRIVAEVLPENRGMRRVFQKMGFTMVYDPDAEAVKCALVL